MLDCLVDQFLLAGNIDTADRWLKLIAKADVLPKRHGEKIIENYANNNFISNSSILRESTNELLKRSGMNSLPELVQETSLDDEIPF